MDVTFYDTVTKKPVCFFDTLKITSLENKASESFARGGKGNAKLLSWDFDREATMKIQDALLSPRSFELLSGNKVTVGTTAIQMRQSTEWDTTGASPINKGSLFPLTASGTGAINLAFTPKEQASDILVYEAKDDGGTPLASGTLSGKTLTNVAWANKKLVVYYTYDSANDAETYVISSDKFPTTFKIIGDTVVRNAETGQDEAFQIVIEKAKLKSDFNLGFKADGRRGWGCRLA